MTIPTKPCAGDCGAVLTRREGEKTKRWNVRRLCPSCVAARRRVGLRLGPEAERRRHAEMRAARTVCAAMPPMRFEDAPEAVRAGRGVFRLARPATVIERASSAANAVVG